MTGHSQLAEPPQVSAIIPVYNEADSLAPLHAEIAAAMVRLGGSHEVIFVDDGSSDGSAAALALLAVAHPNVRVIEFRRNFGKAAALDAGFRAASGEIVVTMDADGQDDPAEIPRFLAKLSEGYDVVSGWKKRRLDPIGKRAPSKLFNAVVSRLCGLRLNDFNCGFKAYRAEALADLRLYGELHRFIPVILHWRGFKVGEIAVNHRARVFGRSKYGLGRFFKGGLDLLTIIVNTRYRSRPLHIFGGAGALVGAAGFAILLYLTVLWMLGEGPIGNRPLLFLGILLATTSLQFFTIGLLGEFIQNQHAGVVWRVRSATNVIGLEDLEPEIRRLKRAAQSLREAETWRPPEQPSDRTPAQDTAANTPTRTRFSA